MQDFNTFPDEVKEALAPHMDAAPGASNLSVITQAIITRLEEAVTARGDIEAIWADAEDAYIGIDDQNRHEFGPQRWSKPPSSDGPLTSDTKTNRKRVKSNAFIRLTSRYVDAGSGKLIEILLPPDDRPFSFKEMPVPELINAKEDNSPVLHDGLGTPQPVPLFRPLKQGETPPPAPPAASPATAPPPAGQAPLLGSTAPAAFAAGAGQPMQPPAGQVPLTAKDLAEEKIELARKQAKLAEDRVYNWMVSCGHSSEVRKMIFDGARIGVGVIKGPVPIIKKAMAIRKEGENGIALEIQQKVQPATKWVDPWNCYPDPACGENIQDGDYFFEKDFLSERQVRKLKDEPGYIASQLDKVLEEGPEKINLDESSGGQAGKPGEGKKRKRFPVWYYYGTLKRSEYLAGRSMGNKVKDAAAGLKADQDLVFCICTLINDTLVRNIINPLESGELPYHAFPWQRRTGSWAGIGVGEQMRVPQRMVNAGTRRMLDNAGASSGGQIVMDKGCIIPADGDPTITPDKIWYKNQDSAAMSDVRQAFQVFEIPNVTEQLMSIIKYGMELAEESTSIPLVTQGKAGETSPETLGATQLQDNNANQLLRSIGYTFDDYVTEPLVRQFYEWLLLDPDVPNEEKGEFEIDAHGSVTLVERAIMDQTIAQLGPTVLNPAYGLNPKLWAEQFLKTKRLDPKDFKYTPEEQARMDANPVKPVQVQVAETNAASREKVAAGDQQVEGQKVENQHTQAAADVTVRLHEAQTEIDGLKVRLAETTMKLNMQQQLNAQDIAAELHKHHQPPPPNQRPQKPNGKNAMPPPVQVPGKAGNGKAFEQAPG